MFFYKHKLRDKDIKNIPFFIALFSLLPLFLYFSGCLSFCSLDSSEDKECISYSEAISLCEEISKPIENYPICSDFSKSKNISTIFQTNCDDLFNDKISKELNFTNLSLSTEQLSNQLRQQLINSWKSSDKIALEYKLINEDCDSFLTSNFSDYKYKIKNELYYFDNYNKNIILLIIADLFSAKKDLQDNNVSLTQNTLVYSDYIELNNILNEFQKSFGKEIEVKESSITKTISFYTNYYSNSQSNISLSDAISTLSNNNQEDEQISSFVGWVIALSGVISYGLINPASSTISLLVKGFNTSESFSDKISNIIENASEKTNLSEWNKLNMLRIMLVDFEQVHGKYNYDDKALFELLSNIDFHITQLKKDNDLKKKDLLSEINKLIDETNLKIVEKETINILYARYNIIESPIDLKQRLLFLKENIELLNNLNYGEMYYYLLQYGSEFDSLKSQINTYFSSDYKSILSLCSSDIITLKTKISNMPESQNRTILQSYISLFLDSKEEYKKLTYCAKILSLTSNNIESNCLSSLNNLSQNITLNLNLDNYTESQCLQEINHIIISAYDSVLYSELENLYKKLQLQSNLLSKIYSQSNCISNLDYQIGKQELSNYNYLSNFSENKIISGILDTNVLLLKNNISKTIDNIDILLSKSLICFYQNNFEIDSENKTINFSNNLPNYSINFKVKINNYGITNIVAKECLKSIDISKDEITFDFSCVDNSNYGLIFKSLLPKQEILNLNVNQITGILYTKICIPNQSELKYYFDLPTNADDVMSVYSNNFNAVSTTILNNKLRVIFSEITNNEKCFNIDYLLNKSIISDLNLISVNIDTYIRYYFDLNIKNTLYYKIDKLKYYLHVPENKIINGITLKENNLQNYVVGFESKLPYFNLSLFALESKKFNYFVIVNKDLNFDDRIKELKSAINKLKSINYISESKVKSYLSELYNIENISNDSDKEKKLFNLEKEINELLSEYEINKIYLDKYNSLKTSILNLQTNYKKIIIQLKEDYNLSVSEVIFFDLESKINEAEILYNNGKIKNAIKVLETIKSSKLDSILYDLFSEKAKKTKELLNTAKQLNIQNNYGEFEKLGYTINSSISIGDYLFALMKLKEYSNLQKTLEEDLLTLQNNTKKDITNTITKYSEYKKKLDSMWQRYSNLEECFNSTHYESIKNFGVDFGFTKSNLTSLKNKLTTVTNKLVNLDKESKIEFSEFNFEKFDNFYLDLDNLNDLLNQYYETMKNKAQSEITFAASKISLDNPEFYKAKDAYDSNNFVDAIYFAKLSQLNSKEISETNWSLYIGLGFIALLVILVIIFGRKFDFSERKIKKETYYSIDKEE